MPNYVSEALQKFQHPAPYRPEHAPHDWTKPAYGQRQQFVTPHNDSNPLDQDEINRVQQVVGTFLYYARAIDSTAMVAINSISGEQAKATENTAKKVTHLLNYFATQPDATLRYNKSGMVLKLHTSAAYLVEPRARSRHGAHYWLGTLGINDNNGAIKNNASIIKPVVQKTASIIRQNLPPGCPGEIAKSYSAKSTRKGSITELGAHRRIRALDACA